MRRGAETAKTKSRHKEERVQDMEVEAGTAHVEVEGKRTEGVDKGR